MKLTSFTTNKAAEVYQTDQAEAVSILTQFSNYEAMKLCDYWKDFYKYLFVKYMDGNVKYVIPTPKDHKYIAPRVEQPKYSDEFYKAIIEETGDKLKVY